MIEILHAPVRHSETDFNRRRPMRTPLDPALVPLLRNPLAAPVVEDADDLLELGAEISPTPFLDDDVEARLGLFRGILIGLLLVAPFWGAVVLIFVR